MLYDAARRLPLKATIVSSRVGSATAHLGEIEEQGLGGAFGYHGEQPSLRQRGAVALGEGLPGFRVKLPRTTWKYPARCGARVWRASPAVAKSTR